MNISIRTKKLQGGKESVYLDCYFPNSKPSRLKEYLKLYLYSDAKGFTEKEHNKKTIALAESIKAKRLLELQHNKHGFTHLIKNNLDLNFLDYFEKQAELRKESRGNYTNWTGALSNES